MSSDGILRLDLDLEDAVMPNGAHYANVDGSETSKEKQLVSITEEEAQPDPDVSPPKKVIKPLMPPIKEAKPSTAHEDEPQKNDGSEKKVCQIFLKIVIVKCCNICACLCVWISWPCYNCYII